MATDSKKWHDKKNLVKTLPIAGIESKNICFSESLLHFSTHNKQQIMYEFTSTFHVSAGKHF